MGRCFLHSGPHFDDLLECEGVAKHHGPLGGDHLLVDGVVEMSHLEIHQLLIQNLYINIKASQS